MPVLFQAGIEVGSELEDMIYYTFHMAPSSIIYHVFFPCTTSFVLHT